MAFHIQVEVPPVFLRARGGVVSQDDPATRELWRDLTPGELGDPPRSVYGLAECRLLEKFQGEPYEGIGDARVMLGLLDRHPRLEDRSVRIWCSAQGEMVRSEGLPR